MPECIATRERAVGPGFVARIPQKQTTSRELGAACLDGLGMLAECCGDSSGTKLLTYSTRNLQDLALAIAQVLELKLDQAAEILRNRRRDVLEPTGERPFASRWISMPRATRSLATLMTKRGLPSVRS